MTTRKALIKVWIISPVQFIDDHFPDWMTSGWASLSITVALVGHPVVQSVGPDGNAAKGSRDGGVVDKELVSHHLKLLVSSNAKVWSADTNHRSVSDVGKPLNDQPGSSHFSKPVIIGTFGPVFRIILVCDRENANLVTPTMKLLDS